MSDISFAKYEKLLRKLAGDCTRQAAYRGLTFYREDLFQEFSIVFVRASRAYDPDQGVKFSTYLAAACRSEFARMAQNAKKDATAHTATPAKDESGFELMELVPDTTYLAQDATLAARQNINMIRDQLKKNERSIFELAMEPPAWLIDEVQRANAKRDVATELCLRKPNTVSLSFKTVASFLGYSRYRAGAIEAKIMGILQRKEALCI